jgi:hypothetical protein
MDYGFEMGPMEQLEAALAGKEVYSNSKIQRFKSCRKRYQNEYERGLTSDHPNKPANFGSVTHEALASLYRTGEIEKMLDSYEFWYDRLFPQEVVAENEKYDRAWGMNILLQYVEHYHPEPFLVRPQDVELGYIVGFPETGFYYIGKVDMLARYRINQKYLWIVDHKTTSSLKEAFFNRFKIDPQTTGYEYGMRRCAPDEEIGGVIINAISTTVKTEFARHPVRRQPRDLVKWAEDVQHWVKEIRRAKAEDLFLRNEEFCTSYGVCPFLTLCQMHDDQTVMSKYIVKERKSSFHFNEV